MAIRIRFPMALRSLVGGRSELAVEARTIQQAMDAACLAYPGLERLIFHSDGGPRGLLRVLRNGEDVRELDGLATRLADGDELALQPAMFGDTPSGASRISEQIRERRVRQRLQHLRVAIAR